MNQLSAMVFDLLIRIGERYRKYYNIPDKHIDLWTQTPFIHELPFNLIIKLTGNAEQEAMATRAARAMGLPVPRILCYADRGPKEPGYILMTRIPGQPLWDIHKSCSAEELIVIQADIGKCLKQIRRFASPFKNAVCGPGGGVIHTRVGPNNQWPECKSVEEFHNYFLRCANDGPKYDDSVERYAEACKIKEMGPYRVVLGHGDLHPSNIMVKDGRLSGIIDWGAAGW
jgi:aminoglycoside phosphotransferase (APT) family kinase protein